MKRLFFPILLILIFTPRVYAKESSPVLVINQIRGPERCCQPGTTQLMDKISESPTLSLLPIAWALRYDALFDDAYRAKIPSTSDIGLLLEITPQLAADSGVVYKGDATGADWHFAKNAFLIGYTPDQRKALIDTLFQKYFSLTGIYPQFTVSWMIDSYSLAYISQKYQVKLHELTKEQYETDSYTLYGGIFNAGYLPSRNHPLVPGSKENALPLVIVRQTISDPLKNYGSSQAFYTSQPNDYLTSRENLNLDYFKSLLTNNINQKAESIVSVVGFENTFTSADFMSEFLNQLNYLAGLNLDNSLNIVGPNFYAQEFLNKYPENRPFCLTSQTADGRIQAIWYFSNYLRARIVYQNGILKITDLRFYENLSDPYSKLPAQTDYAYWIIPSLIDGSLQYSLSPQSQKMLVSRGLNHGSVVPDVLSNPFSISIDSPPHVSFTCNQSLRIENPGGDLLTINNNEIIINSKSDPYFSLPFKLPLADIGVYEKRKEWFFANYLPMFAHFVGGSIKLGFNYENKDIDMAQISQKGSNYVLTPIPQKEGISAMLFQPDTTGAVVDAQTSIFFWSNRVGVAGRNPARLFILPKNVLGRPAVINTLKVDTPGQNLRVEYPRDFNYRISPWFIDIYSELPLTGHVSIEADGVMIAQKEEVKFLPNCKKDVQYCLYHPGEFLRYLLLSLGTFYK